eukprot:TRINITY_DN10062_c0_g1_i2.p1 TRINITY_DN10062_c0_g1~~TRINITY_DN10062_c0_g1_i2.p1  ORF type:complete len:140 (+),score=29.47 TRINITY_DN10062_c0_g1_i2:399-818(+)
MSKMNGLTLDDCGSLNARIAAFMNLEMGRNFEVVVTFAQNSNKEEFSNRVVEALTNDILVGINYQPSSLIGTQFSGHFSPLVAYHKGGNVFLILDVWETIDFMWVPLDDLWDSINSLDYDSKVSRGWWTIGDRILDHVN